MDDVERTAVSKATQILLGLSWKDKEELVTGLMDDTSVGEIDAVPCKSDIRL